MYFEGRTDLVDEIDHLRMLFNMSTVIYAYPFATKLIGSDFAELYGIHGIHQIRTCIFRNDNISGQAEIHHVSITWDICIVRKLNLGHAIVHHGDMLYR